MNERICIADKKPEVKSRNAVPQIRKKTESYQSMNSHVDRILFLQRTIGNHAVGKLIKSGALQAKLRIGQPNDIYEQEADRVAEQVMRMPDVSEAKDTRIQRKCPRCLRGLFGKDKRDEKLQAKEIRGETPEVTSNMETNINALRGGGQPLPESVSAFFEPRFGTDFSQVRVHSGATAEQSARELNANAYTVGHNIVFGAGQLSLGTQKGRQLLAHELTHVVQQSCSNGLHIGQVGEKPGMTPIAHTIQQTEQINRQDETSTTPAAAAVGTAEITLETGNIGAGFLNNLVHQQICVAGYGPGRKRCFSFAATGAQLPQFSSTWLGWSSWVTGAILKGEVYEPPPVSGAKIVSRHTPTATQGTRWLNYILSTRLGLQDAYSVARHNCRTFSQWEFRDAPGHW